MYAPSPCLACIDWAEHLRQHERVTVTDQAIEARAFAFMKPGTQPVSTHFIAARAVDFPAPSEPPYSELS